MVYHDPIMDPRDVEGMSGEGEDGDLLFLARTWWEAGHPVAIATVTQTWGSSPRPAGSVLVIRKDGLFEGSVSGGCIEGEVVQAALEVMKDGVPRHLEFGVTNDLAWQVGLACGGRIEIFVEALR